MATLIELADSGAGLAGAPHLARRRPSWPMCYSYGSMGPFLRTTEAIYWRLRHPRQLAKRILTDVRVRDRLIYNNVAALVEAHDEPGRSLTAAEFKVFSQNGEDGVLAEIFRRIGTTNRYFVEFGIGNGSEGNSVFLADVLGWSGLFIEGSPGHFTGLHRKYRDREAVATLSALVRPDNVNALFRQSEVPENFDLLSIDIDGNDYWVWEALEAFRPRVVVIEYNGLLKNNACLVQPYDPDWAWDGTEFYGASLGALRSLGRKKGYVLVHTELSGTNAFLVQADLAAHFADIEPVAHRSLSHSLQGVGPRPSRTPRHYLVVDDVHEGTN
ncbi:MAG: hypothetical protein ABR540_19590 [Acidimicrobiales bacterium]